MQSTLVNLRMRREQFLTSCNEFGESDSAVCTVVLSKQKYVCVFPMLKSSLDLSETRGGRMDKRITTMGFC